MRTPELPDGVALTAVAMAQERAFESARADRLFDDPWAGQMVRAASAVAAPSWISEHITLSDIAPGMAGYVPMRTRWIDDRLLDGAHPESQVVLLGAGLDTRAARLSFPYPVPMYTVDQPEVLAFAETVVPGAARAVPADLGGDWASALIERGFDRTAATTWVVEGVLMYLPEPAAGRLLRTARELSDAPSRLLADMAHPDIQHNELFAEGRHTLRENRSPIRCAVADPVAWFAGHGWQASAIDPNALAARYGRPVPAALHPSTPTFTLNEAH